MKIILCEDILKLGRAGDVVNVADGYARNFLLSQKKAVVATKSRQKIFEQVKKGLVRKEQNIVDEHQKICDLLEKNPLIFLCKVGEKSQMFGSVTTLDIQKRLEKEGFNINKKDIKMDHVLNKLGDYEVSIRLHPRVLASVQVHLVATQ